MMRKSFLPICLAAMALAAPLTAQDPPKGFGSPDSTIRIKTLEAQMKYDIGEFTVRPGAKVKLVLDNIDSMPHNLVIAKPQNGDPKGLELAKEAWAMAESGFEKLWIPDSPRVIANTTLVDPKKEEAIYFIAPKEEGDYPYVCTIPGHAMVMNGVMHVTTARADLFELNYRVYEGSWDKLPDFDKLKPVSAGEVPSAKIDINVTKLKQNFAIRWVGKIEVKKEGEYRFRVNSDDGSRVTVGDKVVVDHDGVHAASEKEGAIALHPGEHTVTIDYFEKSGEESLAVWWSGPGFSNRPLSVDPPKGGNKGGNPSGLPLIATNGEAIMYRNFIQGASARGIGVGYPTGVNICFDADQMSVAMVWQGLFMDAKRHWTGRGQGYQPPGGYGVIQTGKAPGVAILESDAADWPATKTRAEGVRFLGYKLDKKRYPTFFYEIGGVHVSDRCDPGGDINKGAVNLTRKVSFAVKDGSAPTGLYLRVATGNIKPDEAGKDRYWISDAGRVTAPGAVMKGNNLVVPVKLTGGKAEVALTYDWGL